MWCKQHILSCKHQAQLGTFLQLHHTDNKNREQSSKDWDMTHRAKCLLQGMYKCSHPCIQRISAEQINAQEKRQPAKSYKASSCVSRYVTRLSTGHKLILKKKISLFEEGVTRFQHFWRNKTVHTACTLQVYVYYGVLCRTLLASHWEPFWASVHQVSKEQNSLETGLMFL